MKVLEGTLIEQKLLASMDVYWREGEATQSQSEI